MLYDMSIHVNHKTVILMPKKMVTFRLDSELKSRLDRITAQKRDVYAPTKTQIIERGIDLALRELEAKRGRRSDRI
jgi:predicted transcriptional regulator